MAILAYFYPIFLALQPSFWYQKTMLSSSETIERSEMLDYKIEKWSKLALFVLIWSLFYIILGFEVTVVAALLLILAELRK